jgi:hypothetical protein
LSVRDNLTLGQIKVLGRSKEEAVERGLHYLDRVGCWRTRTSSRPSSRAASSSGWPSPARWRWTRLPCCSTSRPRRWIRR